MDTNILAGTTLGDDLGSTAQSLAEGLQVEICPRNIRFASAALCAGVPIVYASIEYADGEFFLTIRKDGTITVKVKLPSGVQTILNQEVMNIIKERG